MSRRISFILTLFLWTVLGRGVDSERVTGVLDGRVELRGRDGHRPDVQTVEWTKYSKNSPNKLLYKVIKPSNITCIELCQNITFNLQNMSLIFVHLTQEDEAVYEETSVFKNGTLTKFNVTLSLLFLGPTSPVASKITVSSSNCSLTLTCEVNGEFNLLQWFRDGLPLSEDQRFSFTENKKTMQVSNLNTSYCTTYTCQVSNENGKSEVQVSVTGIIPDISLGCTPSASSDFIKHILLAAGLPLISLLVLCIILICICKCYIYGCKKIKTPSTNEPVYDEPAFLQEEAAIPTVEPLLIVYQDYVKPKNVHQSEDFGYSTITDVVENMQPSQTT